MARWWKSDLSRRNVPWLKKLGRKRSSRRRACDLCVPKKIPRSLYHWMIEKLTNINRKKIMSTQTHNEFMLLFRGDEWYKGLSAEELQNVMSQFQAWFDRLSAQGKVKAGQPLVRKGAIVSGKNGRLVSDGPFAESKEAIGGYLLLDVETLEEAIAIARTNPALAYGTSIEIRPVTDECPLDTWARESALQEQLANA